MEDVAGNENVKCEKVFLPLEKGQSLLHILGLDLHSTLNKYCILVFYNIIKAPALWETKGPV